MLVNNPIVDIGSVAISGAGRAIDAGMSKPAQARGGRGGKKNKGNIGKHKRIS